MTPELNAHLYDTANDTAEVIGWLEQSDMQEDWPESPQIDLAALLTDPRQADRINAALGYLEALSAMTAGEIARQQARQRAIEEAAYQIERAVKGAMEEGQTTTVHGQLVTLQIKANPPAVKIDDAAAIPEAFKRTPPPPPAVPDKTAIKRAIEAGTFVPGAALVRGSRLVRK